MLISEEKLDKIIKESVEKVINEAQVKMDRFAEVAKILKFDNPDQFYFLSIMKRKKDNPHDDRSKGNYNQGAWYIKNYRIFSPQDLLNVKDEVIKLCEKNNARAVLTINPRSAKQTDAFITQQKSKHPHWTHVEDRIPAQAKKGGEWIQSRPRGLIDVDVKQKWVHDHVLNTLKTLGIEVESASKTPSGGLHVVVKNGYDPNMRTALSDFANINKKLGTSPYGRMAAIGFDLDAFDTLYSNVKTKGY